MEHQPTPVSQSSSQQRDRLLRKILGGFVVASVATLFLAVATAVWQQNHAPVQGPQALAADAPR